MVYHKNSPLAVPDGSNEVESYMCEDESKESSTINICSQRCKKNKNDTNSKSNKHSMPFVNVKDPSSLLAYSATELLMMVDETVAENYPFAIFPPPQHSPSNVLHSSFGGTSNVNGKIVVLALEAPGKAVRKQRKNVLNSKKLEISSTNFNKKSNSKPKGFLKRYKRPMVGVEGSSSAAQVRARVKKQENVSDMSSDGSSEDTISDHRGD